MLRESFPGEEANRYINDDELPVNSIHNSLAYPLILSNSVETPDMARGATVEASCGQKLRMSIDVDEASAARRSRAEDGVRVDKPPSKKASEAIAHMSMRTSLDRWYDYVVVVRTECIDIVPVVGGTAGFSVYRR
eukprot:IDg8280t1